MLNPELFALLSGGNKDMSAQGATPAPAPGVSPAGTGTSLFDLMSMQGAPQAADGDAVAMGARRKEPPKDYDPKSNPYQNFIDFARSNKNVPPQK